jgi:3-hydroxyacyl-[acyl-carrier-protein] dehydratase
MAMLDIREIFERLPHRYPILLVDRVLELKPSKRLVAMKNVTINEGFFRGHFPGNPIMPGVLILEALAQAAGLLISASLDNPARLLPYLVGVDGVKFRRPVVPGDRLGLEVEVMSQRKRYWKFRAAASVDGERAAEAQILLALLDRMEEAP